MRISVGQIIALVSVVVIFWGLSRLRSKPFIPEKENTELQGEAILVEARSTLQDTAKTRYLIELERRRAEAATRSIAEEAQVLQLLSQTWNEWQNFVVGGIYAEEVARLLEDAQAWAIAGTTYGIGFRRAKDEKLKIFSAKKAIDAFKQAQNFAPKDVDHRINEAIMYIDRAQVDRSVMPMTGIRKLQALDTLFQNNVKVNLALARLSYEISRDYQKAIPRFRKVLSIADTAVVDTSILLEVNYALSDCYRTQKDTNLAIQFLDNCLSLVNEKDTSIANALKQERFALMK